jgi:ATP-dependent DNA helicase RecG
MVIRVPEFDANPAEIPQVVPVTVQVTGEATDEVAGEVTVEVLALLNMLKTAPMGRKDVQDLVDLKGQANFRERYLEPALSGGLLK